MLKVFFGLDCAIKKDFYLSFYLFFVIFMCVFVSFVIFICLCPVFVSVSLSRHCRVFV
jgi:hypothetical protein